MTLGIGNATLLKSLHITPVLDLPQVGENLQVSCVVLNKQWYAMARGTDVLFFCRRIICTLPYSSN